MTTVLQTTSAHRFEYKIEELRLNAQHFTGGDKGRILMFPDWEGIHTNWAARIAHDYAKTCQAEVILTDHYGVDLPTPSFEHAYEINQGLLTRPDVTRPLFQKLVQGLEDHWTTGGPLIVVGFCSGGSFALETGRSGAGIDAAICIHGNPQTPQPISALTGAAAPESHMERPIFVVVHGGDDPLVSDVQLHAFETEMRTTRSRWALHIISGAKHSFTRFDTRRASHAIGYSRRADIEARHLVRAQMDALRETWET